MTIHIVNEVTIDMGAEDGESLSLWLVHYGRIPKQQQDRWNLFLQKLARCCGEQGWLLEVGDDPYQEKSLAVFAGGFGTPDSAMIRKWAKEQREEWEE